MRHMRTGVEFISSCACMDIMFDRANSNVKLASSSRVESSRVLERSSRVRVLERSSTSTSARVLECEGSDLRVKLEYECSSFTH